MYTGVVRVKVGDRVRLHQPLGLTTRKVVEGTVDHLAGASEGLPTLHLVDVVVEREGVRRELGRRYIHRHDLNWEIEVL